jgi:hypothetical protein
MPLKDFCSTMPQDVPAGSPSPRKDTPASIPMAAAMTNEL